MSWQGFESVLDNSKITDSTGRMVFAAVASFANKDGVVGAGGKESSPTIDRIADRAGCARRTVLNWIPKLEESGELVVERLGKGAGKWNRYTVNLPMPTDSQADKNNGANGASPSLTDEIRQLKETVNLLVQTVQALAFMVQNTVHNGSGRISEPELDTMIQEGDTELLPPTPATGEQPSKQQRRQALSALEKHFSAVSNLPVPKRGTDKEKKAAAVTWWTPLGDMWEQADWDVELTKQHLTAVVTRMRREGLNVSSPNSVLKVFQNDVAAGKGNGVNGNSKDHLWTDEILAYLNGNKPFTELCPPVQQFIRVQGESNVKRQPIGVTKKLWDAMNGARH